MPSTRKAASRPSAEQDITEAKTPTDAPQAHRFPLEISLGYQIRSTHRALQRYLRSKIEPHGISLGMWYYLRVLWQQDGVTQRELSRRIGTMEPTTMNAIGAMERAGLVQRVRDEQDRRRLFVFLTPKGRQISAELLPLAAEVVRDASHGLTPRETAMLLQLLGAIQENLADLLKKVALENDDAGTP